MGDSLKNDRSSEVASGRQIRQSAGAERPARRDSRVADVTRGDPGGADGEPVSLRARLRRADRRDLVSGWVTIAVVALLVMTVNAMTARSDMPDTAWWEPWSWEVSSAVTTLALMWLPWLTMVLAPPTDLSGPGLARRLRFGGVHLVGVVVFSVLHVAGFVALRRLTYGLMDAGPYEFNGLAGRFLYEFRKDLLSYGTFVAVFWLVGRLRRGREAPLRPVSFDIRDGGRIIRAPLEDIVAVSSAGNYVEFCLADGRRPLMRATLAAIEVELEGFGFVRAHRSWLVNARKVTGLRPEGSGDWTVELGPVEAPLSRRYPQALERLKAPD
jgi:DNA-binding LytR/AlgR family response regulator